jgi:hypothetical protein
MACSDALTFDAVGGLYVVNYNDGTVTKLAPGATTAGATLTGLKAVSLMRQTGRFQ